MARAVGTKMQSDGAERIAVNVSLTKSTHQEHRLVHAIVGIRARGRAGRARHTRSRNAELESSRDVAPSCLAPDVPTQAFGSWITDTRSEPGCSQNRRPAAALSAVPCGKGQGRNPLAIDDSLRLAKRLCDTWLRWECRWPW